MIEELLDYLDSQDIEIEDVIGDVVVIGGKTYQLLMPTNGLIFDNGFELMTEPTEMDFYCFRFGGKWYYTPKGSEDSPRLIPMRYIGNPSVSIPDKHYFGVHGGYEILNGSRLYKDWVEKAKFLKIDSLAICEKNTLAGVMKFQEVCKANGIKPIIGATYSVYRPDEDLIYDVKVFVKNEIGWDNILTINTKVNVENYQIKRINEKDFFKYFEGLFVVIDPKTLSYENVFPYTLHTDEVFFAFDMVEYQDKERDDWYLTNLNKYINSDIRPIPISDAYYLEPEDGHIKARLNKISGVHDYISKNQYFKPKEHLLRQMTEVFGDSENTIKYFSRLLRIENLVAQKCNFTVETGKRHLPEYEMTAQEVERYGTSLNMFNQLLDRQLKDMVPEHEIDVYRKRLENEKKVIIDANVHDYFLMVRDICNWCRRNDILVGVGRGSAGGTLVGYLLGLHYLDSIKYNLIFERFLNEGRAKVSLPDIDTDVEGERRDEVKHYIEQRFGVNQVCSIGTYGTLRMKALIKDLGRQENVEFEMMNAVTNLFDMQKGTMEELFQNALQNGIVHDFIDMYPETINDLPLALNQPRSQSIHACAMVVLPKKKDVFHTIPVKKILKGDSEFLVSEWEGNEIETVGLLKEDVLGLSELDKFRFIINLLKEDGISVDIYNLPLNDKKTLKYMQKGWNSDVFQFGTPGLISYCREMKPESLEDLIAAVALYRPGPMENGFHSEYIARKNGLQSVTYMWGTESITKPTYGLIVYQEQVMRICQELAGFSLVEADDVRKAMGKKKLDVLMKHKERFLSGAQDSGCDIDAAEEIWQQLEKFASYSFNRSHAAAYAITGYIGQYLKAHYPSQFWASAISFADEKSYPKYLAEIHEAGTVSVKPININKSGKLTYVDVRENAMYWPIISVSRLGDTAVTQIIEERSNGQFFDFADFLDRVIFKGSKVNKSHVENLILSGAFDDLEDISKPKDRKRLLERFYELIYPPKKPRKGQEPKVIETILTENAQVTHLNWWWTLQQKAVSGIAFFDYDAIAHHYEMGMKYDYVDVDYFNQYDAKNGNLKGFVVGYVSDIQIKQSHRGDFANITLESNYKFMHITLWHEDYVKFAEQLDDAKKGIMIVSGSIGWDNYRKQNSMTASSFTEIIILK